MNTARARHLVRRFFGSLVPLGPSAPDEAWVTARLSRSEQSLWSRMGRADRRHAASVARGVERALGARAGPPVLAAALLHDVGKVESGLGTLGRVLATVAGTAGRAELTPRVARYLRHDEIGADLLRAAGSDPVTVAWAREHHLSPDRWSLPADVAAALKAADDD